MLSFIGLRSFTAPQVFAQDADASCYEAFYTTSNPFNATVNFPSPIVAGSTYSDASVSISGLAPGIYAVSCQRYDCGWFNSNCNWVNVAASTYNYSVFSGGELTWTDISSNCWANENSDYRLIIRNEDGGSCNYHSYKPIPAARSYSCTNPTLTLDDGRVGCFEVGDSVHWQSTITSNDAPVGEGISFTANALYNQTESLRIVFSSETVTTDSDGAVRGVFTIPEDAVNHQAYFALRSDIYGLGNCRNYPIPTIKAAGVCSEEDRDQVPPDNSAGGAFSEFNVCGQLLEGSAEKRACEDCRTLGGGNATWTAVGCFSGEPSQIIGSLIKIGLNIGGGVALIMILVAGFMFTTSQGDPKKTNEAKELMTSAVIGLLFIIFSVTILQFIGVSILQIPGFGSSR